MTSRSFVSQAVLGAALLVTSCLQAENTPAPANNDAAPAGTNQAARVGSNWPQWRGPKRDGISTETGLLQKWGEEGPPLAWKTSGLGEGLASVVLSEGRVFTMGKRNGAEFLIARAADDGHELWSTRVGTNSADNPSSTPTVDGERVYALGPQGDLICAEAASGREVWRKSFTKDFGGSVPGWHYCESPLVDGDRLICTPGSAEATIVALDKKTGNVIWKTAVPGGAGGGFGYSSIVVGEGAGVRQYVQLLGAGAGCVGVAAADGKLLWSYARVANPNFSLPVCNETASPEVNVFGQRHLRFTEEAVSWKQSVLNGRSDFSPSADGKSWPGLTAVA